MSKIGFIGMGNMAKAIASGFVKSGVTDEKDIYAYAPTKEKLMKNAKEIGFRPVDSASDATKYSDIILIGCKPYQIEGVINEIHDVLKGKVLISIAAGWDYNDYFDRLKEVRIQCVMPNTPAMVGEGVFLFEEQNNLEPEELITVRKLFEAIGTVVTLPGRLMTIGTAISGCGPAFMDMIMEAFADGGVKYGLQRETAYKLISKTMEGSAKLQLETGKHPGVLKDEVCSPGGMTIKGVTSLEKSGMRNACIECIDALMK